MRRHELDAFIDAELPRLLGYARALTGSDHDAWDLTQEALVRMSRRWSGIRGDGNPAAYARTVLVRLHIDGRRRRRREVLTGEVPEAAVAPEPPGGLEPWVLAALATLTPRQRTAVLLRHLDDLDLASIADVMGCSVGTAKSHLSRGLGRLRAHVPEEERHG